MKANLKNALMIVAALLVVYVSAFFVTMTLVQYPCYSPKLRKEGKFRTHAPRWGPSPAPFYYCWPDNHWSLKFFAPVIWVEQQILPREYFRWYVGDPVPDWAK